jgi:hypothetical protein
MILEAEWDGKDLSQIQMLIDHIDGSGVQAVMDANWNLTVLTTDGPVLVAIGQRIYTDEHGCVTVR